MTFGVKLLRLLDMPSVARRAGMLRVAIKTFKPSPLAFAAATQTIARAKAALPATCCGRSVFTIAETRGGPMEEQW